jgi:hypothetical protein
MVSPKRASGLGLIRTHYGKKTPKSPQGQWPETEEVIDVIGFPLCAREEGPLASLHSPHPFHLCLCLDVWQTGGMGGGQSKNNPLECMLKNFKWGCKRDYRGKLTPGKLRTFCEIDWPAFDVEWPSEVIVNRVFEVVVGKPRHPDQFLYVGCWQDAVLSWPTWLKPHLEEAYRVMVARVAAASKCREKCKKSEKSILAGDPERTLPRYVPLYPPLPPPSSSSPPFSEGEAASDWEGPAANTPTRLSPGVLETANPTVLRPQEPHAHSKPTSPHSTVPC